MDLTWTARRIRPVVAFYVVAVFLAFMALAHFVFHSAEAVRALLLTCIGSVASLAPGILNRVEYGVTETGLWKRPVSKDGAKEFQEVLRWDEVSRLVPTSNGFRFHKKLDEGTGLARILKRHLSAGYSGELHVEKADRERVGSLLRARHTLSG